MKSDREIIDELVCDQATNYAGDLQDKLERFVLPGCESPIERIMATALFLASWPAIDDYDMNRMRTGYCHPHWCNRDQSLDEWLTASGLIHHPVTDYIVIAPQQKLLKYRVDFLILMDCEQIGRHTAVVECDGHDFHERTKEQAKRDKSRDRELQALGHAVLRFTGSEVFKDATACAEQVAQHFWKIAQRHYSAKRAPFATQEHVA